MGPMRVILQSTFVRYLIVGAWNTFFGMAIYAMLYYWLGRHVHYLVVLLPANLLAIANAFLGYKLFVFRTRGNALREYLRCHVVYGGMTLMNGILLFLAVECVRLPPVFANSISVVLITLVSFLAHRHFSFRRTDGPPSA